MQKIAIKEQTKITLKVSRQAHEKFLELEGIGREFPSMRELGQKRENDTHFEEKECFDEAPNLDPEEYTISIFVPKDDMAPKTEKMTLKIDQQVIIDDIAKTIALSENSTKESKAILNLTVGGEAVIVQIVKRKNRTKVQFSSENSSIRRLLKNTKVELKEAAAKAGLNLHRIEVR